MNYRELKCAEILNSMIENNGVIGIKTSFEDEGALFNETIRLKEICNWAKTKLVLKIGGPEAIRDIKDSLIIGVNGLVAPMVESKFGLKKFIQSSRTYISSDILFPMHLAINLETITAAKNVGDILSIPEANSLYGVTVGRVDLVSSMDKDRSYVDSDEVYSIVKNIFIKAKKKGLNLCLGGAISINSSLFLKKLNEDCLLNEFETRYVIYDSSVALENLPEALAMGQLFELEWLMCKREYYTTISNQDLNRIKMIESRIALNHQIK